MSVGNNDMSNKGKKIDVDASVLETITAVLQAEGVLKAIDRDPAGYPEERAPYIGSASAGIYARSLRRRDAVLYFMARHDRERYFFEVAEAPFESIFSGVIPRRIGDLHVAAARPGPELLPALWRAFPFTKPQSLRDKRSTIGMGDRLGMATAGHIRAVRDYDAYPVLAQQSLREMDYTGRSFPEVVADASFGVFQEGFERGFGADGDHLKSIDKIDAALEAGAPMVTLDLTEVLKPKVADWSPQQVSKVFAELPAEFRDRLLREYAGQSFDLDGAEVRLDRETVERCALLYGDALDFAVQVNDHLKAETGDRYDLEISIDETTTPTLPSHHLFIARELHQRGVTVNSLAPRFIGEFQKGIDYIGNVDEFDEQFDVHCRIAVTFGNYKISVHSGSDKLSVYPSVGKRTGGRLHLKTAGTSWLEAIRVVARTDTSLYRLIHAKTLEYYPTALKSYHITADINTVPSIANMSDADLPSLLDHPAWRQFLHISYGGLLNDAELGPQLRRFLFDHEEEYLDGLERHFRRHLEALGLARA